MLPARVTWKLPRYWAKHEPRNELERRRHDVFVYPLVLEYLWRSGRFEPGDRLYNLGGPEYDPFTGQTITPASNARAGGQSASRVADPAGPVPPPQSLLEAAWERLTTRDLPRVLGAVKAAGGLIKTVVGVSTAWTGVGALVALHGLDTTVAGMRSVLDGEDHQTATAYGISQGAQAAGYDAWTARRIGDLGDAAIAGSPGRPGRPRCRRWARRRSWPVRRG